MKKQYGWVVSASVCLAVLTVMAGVCFLLLTGESVIATTDGKVDAVLYELAASEKPVLAEPIIEFTASVQTAINEEEKTTKPVSFDEIEEQPVIETAVSEPVVQVAAKAPTESIPVEAQNEEPAASPEAVDNVPEPQTQPQPVVVAAPVTYSWGATSNYIFRIEVSVTNNGNDPSRNVMVSVPLLENSSPYQTTTLKSVNYHVDSSSGRVSSFNIGELAPGETKTIIADFDISVKTVSLNSTNEIVEKARIAYEQYAGSGNCRTLALGFINKSREMGITAREVIGFARPERGAMTAGSLQGSRHSWAEFYVDGLGWVPVDLTFQYFGAFPAASHVVESYSDQSIKVNYTGGSLSASWNNIII